MTQVVSIRLKDDQLDRLKRFARRAGKSQSEMGAQFIEESMQTSEFAEIEFRDSTIGRLAYMKASNLAKTVAGMSLTILWRRTSGVFPMASRTLL